VDVPGDISLVSIEDSLLTEVSHPTLTSARQPVRELVDMTVAALAAIIGGEPMPVCQVLQPQLIVRNSSCAPNARV
jgi:DNA-binding LacI/PurR family transcriptional regulator